MAKTDPNAPTAWSKINEHDEIFDGPPPPPPPPTTKMVCSACKHKHRGEATRETDADQCGFPWRDRTLNRNGMLENPNSFGWCGCRCTKLMEVPIKFKADDE